MMSPDLADLDDEALLERSRATQDAAEASRLVGMLFSRYHRRVAGWCLHICGDREEAADLAQEVFLRVHERLDSFRLESRFGTWLYTVTRRVAINRGIAARRRAAEALDDVSEPVAETADPVETMHRDDLVGQLRHAMRHDLEPLEAKVLYLHYATGLTLPAITKLLALDNASGAKAFIVNGKRKLRKALAELLEGGIST